MLKKIAVLFSNLIERHLSVGFYTSLISTNLNTVKFLMSL